MPAKSSIVGFRILRTLGDASSAMYIATDKASGTAMIIAASDTKIVAKNSGNIPKIGAGVAVGNHSVPAKNDDRVILSPSIRLPEKFSGM